MNDDKLNLEQPNGPPFVKAANGLSNTVQE